MSPKIRKLAVQLLSDNRSRSKSVQAVATDELHRVIGYLDAFGYLDEYKSISDPAKQKKILAASLKRAQETLGVEGHGVPDSTTLKAMETTRRCGCSDRQSLGGVVNQWAKNAAGNLTFALISTFGGFSRNDIIDQLSAAWSKWESVCGIRVTPTNNASNANIVIDASASRKEEFGTAGNVLAWAYIPQGNSFTGQLIMKFDLAERWSIDGSGGSVAIGTVACHEFGHLLGLDHTQILGELMYPIYDVNVPGPQSRYDIPEVLRRYGQPLPSTPPVSPSDPSVIVNVGGTIAGKTYKLVPVN